MTATLNMKFVLNRQISGWRSHGWLRLIALSGAMFLGSILSQRASAEAAPIPDGAFHIAGTVVNAKAGSALARCRVTITDAKNRDRVKSLVTGEDGRFEFHVPAGKYSLEGAKRGYITSSYNQHDQFSSLIVTGADLDSENLVLRLAANAVLFGRVLDEFGEPVRNAQMTVYREQHSLGVSRIVTYRGSSTDDQGRYEATSLEEGTYFVSAKGSPWYAVHPTSNVDGTSNAATQVDSSLDVAYPITYYGDATEAADATPIPVRGGDRLEADIHLNPVPSVHLLVHVPQGAIFPMLFKTGFDGAEQVESHDVQNIGPGVYELSGMAAGRYTVRVPDTNGHMSEASDVSIGGSGELDTSSAKATSVIKVAVDIAGSGLPDSLQILLRSSKGKTESAQVDGKGEATFSGVLAGPYDVLAGGATQRYSVVRIATEAGASSGHTLNVPAGATLNIALSLAGGSVTVDGVAQRDGKPFSGAMVVLVPKNAEGDFDRFRRDESNLDGSFTLRDVSPGSYTLVAIENGWDLEWGVPGALLPYLKSGQAIEVGDRSIMKLTDPVVVQTN